MKDQQKEDKDHIREELEVIKEEIKQIQASRNAERDREGNANKFIPFDHLFFRSIKNII